MARGPANPSLNESAGLLVEGFDDDPCALMPYNPPQYADFVGLIWFSTALLLVSAMVIVQANGWAADDAPEQVHATDRRRARSRERACARGGKDLVIQPEVAGCRRRRRTGSPVMTRPRSCARRNFAANAREWATGTKVSLLEWISRNGGSSGVAYAPGDARA